MPENYDRIGFLLDILRSISHRLHRARMLQLLEAWLMLRWIILVSGFLFDLHLALHELLHESVLLETKRLETFVLFVEDRPVSI